MAIAKRVNEQGRTTGYTVTVSVPNPAGGRGKRYTIGTYRLRRDAEAAEREAKSAIQRGEFDPRPKGEPKTVTVEDVVRGWFSGHASRVTANTLNGYESAMRLHVLPALGGIPVAELTRSTVKSQLRTWQEQGMGAQLQHRSLMVLRLALQEAVEDGLIDANVAVGIRKPSPKKRLDIPRWTPQHLAAFLSEAEKDTFGVFWYFAAVEGMRRSEALGARWSDVEWSDDERSAVIRVEQTLVPALNDGGKAHIQQRTKTDSGRRAVLLSATTTEALKRHRDRQIFQRQLIGDDWGPHDLIVTTSHGQPVNPSTIKASRARLIKRAGVPPVTTHQLRHLAITRMLQAGVPVTLVSAKAGHADIALTVGTYGHIEVDDQASANAAIDAFLAKAQ